MRGGSLRGGGEGRVLHAEGWQEEHLSGFRNSKVHKDRAASARLSVAAPQQAEQIPKKSDPRSGERGGHQGSGAAPPEEAADGGPRAEGGHLAGTQVAWSLGSTGIGAGGRASVRLFTSQCLVASSAS